MSPPNNNLIESGMVEANNSTVHCAIDNLCDDILREIFLLCASLYGSTLGYDDKDKMTRYKCRVATPPFEHLPSDPGVQFLSPYPSHQNVPYVFLSVNRRWRDLAKSTHILWNRVSAMPNQSGKGRPSARFVQQWLQWAGQTVPLYLHIAPSDISIRYQEDSMLPSEEEKEEKATLGLFLEHIDRCRVLSIQFNQGLCQKLNEVLYPDSLHEPPQPFSTVETLEFNTESVNFDLDASSWLSFFPSLRHFRLIERRFGILDLYDLPVSHLETLYLDKHLPLDDAVELIRSCTCAKEITLAGKLVGPIAQVAEGSKTKLMNLTKISIRSDPFPGPISLLNHFKMPNLVELELCWTPSDCYRGYQDRSNSASLKAFLEEAECRLKKLVIVDQRIEVEEIAAILSNAMVLQIPEVEIVYAVEWLGDVPGSSRKRNCNLRSPDVLRFYIESRQFFKSLGIDLLFWTRVDQHRVKHYYPYRVWEHIGWDKANEQGRAETQWVDSATGKLYVIGTKTEPMCHDK